MKTWVYMNEKELIDKEQKEILKKENKGDGKNRFYWEFLEKLKQKIIGK